MSLGKKLTWKHLFILLLLLYLAPLWVFRYFPSQDGPSHIYNACRNALEFAARRSGATVVVAPLATSIARRSRPSFSGLGRARRAWAI